MFFQLRTNPSARESLTDSSDFFGRSARWQWIAAAHRRYLQLVSTMRAEVYDITFCPGASAQYETGNSDVGITTTTARVLLFACLDCGCE